MKAWKKLAAQSGANVALSLSRVHCKNVDEEKLKSAAPFSWLTPERISDYYAQSLCYVAVSWARGGMTASAAELTEIYLMLLEKPLASLLREIN